MRFMNRRIPRRIITIGALVLSTIVGFGLAPVWLLGATVIDLVRRDRWFPRTRLVVLILGAIAVEWIALFISFLN